MPTSTRIQPRSSSDDPLRCALHAVSLRAGVKPVRTITVVVARVLVVGARARRPGQLLGGAYDDQLVAPRQQGDRRVEVAVDLLVAHHRDHLVGQRLRRLADLADQQVALGDLEPLAVA